MNSHRIWDKSVTAVFAYAVLMGFADADTFADDSIQEHNWPQGVSCYFFVSWVISKMEHWFIC